MVTNSKNILGHGMDITMNLYGVLLGYTKLPEMYLTSTRLRNIIMTLAWKARLVYFLGMIKLLEFMF